MNYSCSTDDFCELLHEVSSACSRKEAEALAGGGLAVSEFHALSEIAKKPVPPLSDLAEKLNITRGRLTRIIDAIEKKGMVIRRRDLSDSRNVILHITEAGKAALSRAAELRSDAGGSILALMSSEEQQNLIEGLKTLKKIMSEAASRKKTHEKTIG